MLLLWYRYKALRMVLSMKNGAPAFARIFRPAKENLGLP
jgi:hypothetical protein